MPVLATILSYAWMNAVQYSIRKELLALSAWGSLSDATIERLWEILNEYHVVHALCIV